MEKLENKSELSVEESCQLLSKAIVQISKINDEQIGKCGDHLYSTILNRVKKIEKSPPDILSKLENLTRAANCLILSLKLFCEIPEEIENDSIVKIEEEEKLDSNDLYDDYLETEDFNIDTEHENAKEEKEIIETENIDPTKFVITDFNEIDVDNSETDLNSVNEDIKVQYKTFPCDACPKIFISEDALQNHAMKHKVFFTGEEKYTCQVCSKTFKSNSKLKCHKEIHAKNKPFKCDQCPLTFEQSGNLKRHRRSHTGEKPFQCEICLKPFADKRGLNLHIDNKICTKSKPTFFMCKFCPKTAISKSNIRKHEATHSGVRPYQCDICPSAFFEPSNLKLHMRTHTNERPYNCEICSKKFAQLGQLKRHLKSHSGEKPFACDQCANTYADMKNLKFHIKHCHDEVTPEDHRPYECDDPDCRKTFKTDRDLIRHKKVHSPDYIRRFQCEKCEKSFYTQSGLTEHTKVHTGEKPYQCEVCSKAFTNNSNLTIHLRSHSGEKPFNCDICPKSFSTNGGLLLHRAIHTGEKNFKCDICGKAFIQSISLTNHMRTHTGEKPYACEICQKSFSQISARQKHKQNVHGFKRYKEDATVALSI